MIALGKELSVSLKRFEKRYNAPQNAGIKETPSFQQRYHKTVLEKLMLLVGREIKNTNGIPLINRELDLGGIILGLVSNFDGVGSAFNNEYPGIISTHKGNGAVFQNITYKLENEGVLPWFRLNLSYPLSGGERIDAFHINALRLWNERFVSIGLPNPLHKNNFFFIESSKYVNASSGPKQTVYDSKDVDLYWNGKELNTAQDLKKHIQEQFSVDRLTSLLHIQRNGNS